MDEFITFDSQNIEINKEKNSLIRRNQEQNIEKMNDKIKLFNKNLEELKKKHSEQKKLLAIYKAITPLNIKNHYSSKNSFFCEFKNPYQINESF